jgi:hypothetical protein
MNKYKALTVSLILAAAIGIGTVSAYSQTGSYTAAPIATQVQYANVNALELVANPTRYLNRNIRIRAKFDKFSTLGLDYPPVNRPHEKYISFLIQRPDITNHNIPLSELKIFLKKEVAEKNIDLDAGDEIEFTGKVFSTALGDPWMDVVDFKVVNKVKKEDKK